MFFMIAKSRIISNTIEDWASKASGSNMMTKKKDLTWHDTDGNAFYDGSKVAAVVMNMCNPNTNAGAQVLRENIAQATAAVFQKYLPRMI